MADVYGSALTICDPLNSIRFRAFYQNGNPVIDHFHKTTPDFKQSGMGSVVQNLNPPAFQRADQGRMFVQHFKGTGYTGKLDAVNLVAEQLFFRSKYF